MAMLLAVLSASLFGSLHCAGMCGALVAFAVGDTERHSLASRAMLHVAYHGGRLVSYAIIGALCGLLGAALDLGGALVGLNRVAAILAGAMMIGVGIAVILRYAGWRIPQSHGPAFLGRIVMVGRRAAMGFRPLPRALAIGLLTALLPCGWLYAFAIIATGAGSAAWGAAVMVAFWAGTVPVLVSLGVGVQTLTGTLGRRIPLITAVFIVLLGLYTLAGRTTIDARTFQKRDPTASSTDTLEQIDEVGHSKPPCCQHHHD